MRRRVVVTGLIGRMEPPAPPLRDTQVAGAYAFHALGEPQDDDPFSRRDGWRLGGARAPSYWKHIACAPTKHARWPAPRAWWH